MSEIQNQNGADQADVKNKILKQVEFYFGDANLPFDKFLYTLTVSNDDRWVPIDKIASFKKMKLISEDIDLITAALKESEELLEVSEDGLKVRRKTPLVAPESIFQKTVYAKGFPIGEEIDDKAFFDLQEEIRQIFSEFGKVEAVRMRKTDDKPSKFKGSVFIEYAEIDEANKAAEQKLKYKDTDLLIMTKPAYVAMKAEEYKDKPTTNTKKPRRFNAFAMNATTPKPKSNYVQKDENKLLKFTVDKEDLSGQEIKHALGEDKIRFVHIDGTVGFIETKEANASELVDTLNAIEDGPVKVSVPNADEEAEFYKAKNLRQQQISKNKSSNRGGSNRGGSKRGGRNTGGRKRKNDDNPNNTEVKARKTEA